MGLKQIFEKAAIIDGISSIHHGKVVDGQVKTYFLTKNNKTGVVDSEEPPVNSKVNEDLEINIKDWCLVESDQVLCPGEVIRIQKYQHKVSVMIQAGRYYK